MKTVNIKIARKPGAWILNRFYKRGAVVAVDETLGKEHLARSRSGAYELVDDAAEFNAHDTDAAAEAEAKQQQAARDEEARQTPSAEIYELEFPGCDELLKVGINTVEQLDSFIVDNGDGWFKKVDGVGPKTAAEIIDFRAKLKK